jgi:hypothetical protein
LTPQTLTAGTTVNWNMASGTNANLTPAQNYTLANPTNLTAGMMGVFTNTQPAGNHFTITWDSNYRSVNPQETMPALMPALTATNAATDEFIWYSPDGTHVDILVAAKNLANP